jgi:hypothetical protein
MELTALKIVVKVFLIVYSVRGAIVSRNVMKIGEKSSPWNFGKIQCCDKNPKFSKS